MLHFATGAITSSAVAEDYQTVTVGHEQPVAGNAAIPSFTVRPVQFTQPVPNAAPNIAPNAPTIPWPTNAGPTQTLPGFPITGPSPTTMAPGNLSGAQGAVSQLGGRRVHTFPRSSVPSQLESFLSADGRERVTIISSGVNIIIEGVDQLGTVDIATDRLVIWSSADPNAAGAGNKAAEMYMEGDVIFRQGERTVYAQSMYYNVATQVGAVLDAELLTPAPGYEGLLRLKARVLRQVGPNSFQAQDAAFTSSRLGVPRYWFQSGEATFEDRALPRLDPLTGQPMVNPVTGEMVVDHNRLATSRSNFIYAGEIPVFYWPRFATDFTKPGIYLTSIKFGSDRVFGNQVRTEWDLYQIFGIASPPQGTDWTASLDYLSDRGWGVGTTFEYELPSFLGRPGPTVGYFDAWGIDDQGLDNLGSDRRGLTPEEDLRGRVLWKHRQRFWNGLQFSGELGYISDRNFLEQYYEREWDQWKDQSTGFEFKQLAGNGSWNLAADFQLNEFFTQTEWWPRVDQFQMGHSLLGDRL
ncbi:MAG: hypothetical protein KDA60_12435, partial [Planctomycetales bacterium]|nr:hypothetical protein [Planctomycetales bacterium]